MSRKSNSGPAVGAAVGAAVVVVRAVVVGSGVLSVLLVDVVEVVDVVEEAEGTEISARSPAISAAILSTCWFNSRFWVRNVSWVALSVEAQASTAEAICSNISWVSLEEF